VCRGRVIFVVILAEPTIIMVAIAFQREDGKRPLEALAEPAARRRGGTAGKGGRRGIRRRGAVVDGRIAVGAVVLVIIVVVVVSAVATTVAMVVGIIVDFIAVAAAAAVARLVLNVGRPPVRVKPGFVWGQ